jgi:TonB family protein
MKVCQLLRCIFALAIVSVSATHAMCAQDKSSSSPTQAILVSTYPNTKEGLRQLLQDMRAAAKNDEMERLTALIKDTEIPNCVAWLHKMYDSDKADSWEGMCDRKTLDADSESSRKAFLRFASLDGEFFIRKVNDDPMPGKGMEWGWLQAIKAPLDIYFAGWKASGDAENSKVKHIAYFMFIDGGFRREAGIYFVEAKPLAKTAKLIPARLIKKVQPGYPTEAFSQHISGVVRVYFVIGADGAVYNAHAISGEGLSEDSSLRKAAEEAVIQWRYQPATLDGKPILTNAVTVDIIFSPTS